MNYKPLNLKAMIRDYITYIENIKGYSKNTAVAYEKDLRYFARWMRQHNTNARWSTITRDDIDQYIIDCEKQGQKPATTNRHLSAISGLYNYMKRQGHDIDNPCRYESRRKNGQHLPNTIPTIDLQAAYNNSTGATKIMIGLLATTGMRIQELLNLEYSSIDFTTNAIRVRGKGNKDRIVYTTPDMLTTLNCAHLNGNDGRIFFFDQRQARYMIWKALHPYSGASQLSPHAIRHTMATHQATAGTNVTTIAAILGHTDIKTTQEYIDMTQANVREAMQTTLFTH